MKKIWVCPYGIVNKDLNEIPISCKYYYKNIQSPEEAKNINRCTFKYPSAPCCAKEYGEIVYARLEYNKELNDNACTNCGTQQSAEIQLFCNNCGATIIKGEKR